MKRKKDSLFFLIGNKLFQHVFFMYYPLYRSYKIISDRHERNLLKAVIRSGMTVVDIGANIGIYTEFLSGLVGKKGRVYAFEPSPQNFSILKQRQHHNNVTLINSAVGNITGETVLYISDELNVDHRTYDTGENRKRINVKCYRLDDYFKDTRIDFIKMDIQGFEYQAIMGMKDILRNNSDIKIIMEFWSYGLKKAGSSAEELIISLNKIGFQTEIMEGDKRMPCPPISEKEDFSYYRNLFVYK